MVYLNPVIAFLGNFCPSSGYGMFVVNVGTGNYSVLINFCPSALHGAEMLYARALKCKNSLIHSLLHIKIVTLSCQNNGRACIAM